MEGEELDGVVGDVAGVVAQRRGQVGDEAVDRAGSAVGAEIFATEAGQCIDVLPAFLGPVVDEPVGGRRTELVEEIGERTARRALGRLPEAVEHHLHLGPLEEPAGAAHAERHAGPGQRLFERGRLRVDAVEHRHRRPRPIVGVGRPHPRRDAVGLGGVVVVRGDVRRRARLRDRPDRGLGRRPAVGQQRRRDGDDLRRRPVVAPELHHAGARELAREPAEQPGVGAGERVDRLVGVADHAQVGPVAEPGAHEAELRRAGVLELVDEEMAEPPPLHRRELGVGLQRVRAPPDEVVEVEEAAPPFLALVTLVDLGDLGRGARRLAPGARHGVGVTLGADQAGLRPFDLARDLGGVERGLRTASAHEGEQQPDLALDDAGHGAAAFLGGGGAAARARSNGTCPR